MSPSWSPRRSNPAAQEGERQAVAALSRYDFGPSLVILGTGASAVVYKVTDRHLHKAVALKIFRDERALAANELTALATLSSLGGPNLVNLTDYGRIRVPGDQRHLPFIAMDYWQGTTLANDPQCHARWQRMPAVDAQRWCADTVALVQQCFAGLHQIHLGQVKHLDIKPSNIFVTRHANGSLLAAKILDFGLSALGRVSDARGTPLYMAPEQAARSDVTEAADVFAMGVVAYELLTGRHPFVDAGDRIYGEALARNIASVVPVSIRQLNPHVPESVALVIHRTLAKEPADRPSSGEAEQLLGLASVYDRERHAMGAQIDAARARYDGGDFEGASGIVRELERCGWAFPEIVELRTRITAARCDDEVAARVGEATRRLRADDLEGGRAELLAAQQLRRYDPRLLRAEAEYELLQVELASEAAVVVELERALQQGYSRAAWWLLGTLRNRQVCGSRGLVPYRADLADLWGQLDAMLDRETSWLDASREHVRAGRLDDALSHCAAIGASVLRTSAATAQELEVRAQRHRPLIEAMLACLGSASPDERTALATAIDAGVAERPDALADCWSHLQQRRRLVEELRVVASACEASGDEVGHLDAVETLLRICPDEWLHREADRLHAYLLDELTRRQLEVWLQNIGWLAELGEWERAHALIRAASAQFPASRELAAWGERAEAQLRRGSEPTELLARVITHLRSAEIGAAAEALRAAHAADPGSVVLATSCAAYLTAEAWRLERVGEASSALLLGHEAQRTLRVHEDSVLLTHARAVLGAGARATPIEPLAWTTRPSSGGSSEPGAIDAAHASRRGVDSPVAWSDESVAEAPPQGPRTGTRPSLRGLLGALTAGRGRSTGGPEVQTPAADDVVEWELDPAGTPRRKR